MLERFVAFTLGNAPDARTLLLFGLPSLLWAFAALYLAGHLKTRRGVRTGYTRKIFHFAIFSSAALVQSLWGTPALFVFGGATSLVIFYAVFRGSGHLLYEAMARERDEPHRTYFIVAPYFATLVGGVMSNVLFGPTAVVGYLTAGLGDAIGEPVGVRFGRHRYRVPSLRSVKTTRSLEGSAAVFVVCMAAITLGLALAPHLHVTSQALYMVPLLAAACALVEAVSPHGWDNAFLQVVPAFLVSVTF
jgi:phytol kinase